MIFCTGGMSVDPDDRTPSAIRKSGASIVSYGAPVLPGAMFLVSYLPDGRPVCGLPGCVMYARRTIFDLVLPRLLADVPVTSQWPGWATEGSACPARNAISLTAALERASDFQPHAGAAAVSFKTITRFTITRR